MRSRILRIAFLGLLGLIGLLQGAFAQSACETPSESPVLAIPEIRTEAYVESSSETLWTLYVRESTWSYDPATRIATILALVGNSGDERVRACGLLAEALDGAGKKLASAWKTTATVYLEPGALGEIQIELLIPPGPHPATIRLETIQAMGSCGW